MEGYIHQKIATLIVHLYLITNLACRKGVNEKLQLISLLLQ